MTWLNFRHYLSMIKFSHSIFALPLAGIAFIEVFPQSPLLKEDGHAVFLLLLKIIICMIFLRSCAMGFNRLVDRRYDLLNPRTANRELPKKILRPSQVQVFIVLCAGIFMLTAASINLLVGVLSLPALFFVCAYSYTKRFTFMSHFFLGMVIGLVPIAVSLAVLEKLDTLALLWSAGMLFYIAGFDILYACQDYDFDKKNKLHSLPARFGIVSALWTARICHGGALFFFSWAGLQGSSSFVFPIAIAVVGLLFLSEHILVRPSSLNRIPAAFFHVNASISTVLFFGVLFDKYTLGFWPF